MCFCACVRVRAYESSLRGVNRCGQNKRQVATQIEATSAAGAPVHVA